MTWRTMHTSHAHTQASQYLTLLSYWKRHFRRSLSQMISHNDGVWITVTENRHYKFIMTIHRNYYTDLISSYQIADWRHFAKIQPCITGRMLLPLLYQHTRKMVCAQHSPRNRWNVFGSAQNPQSHSEVLLNKVRSDRRLEKRCREKEKNL